MDQNLVQKKNRLVGLVDDEIESKRWQLRDGKLIGGEEDCNYDVSFCGIFRPTRDTINWGIDFNGDYYVMGATKSSDIDMSALTPCEEVEER